MAFFKLAIQQIREIENVHYFPEEEKYKKNQHTEHVTYEPCAK